MYDFDETNAKKVFQIAKWAYIVGSFVRPILVMISYKKPKVIDYYYVYSMLMFGIMAFLPVHKDGDTVKEVFTLRMMVTFVCLYMNIWSSLILSLCTYGVLLVALSFI